MDTKELNNIRNILILIALGVWIIILQNTGLIGGIQRVEVKNGISVHGSVDIDHIRSTVPVEVENTVDINISKINGHQNVFFNDYSRDPDKYYRISVVTD